MRSTVDTSLYSKPADGAFHAIVCVSVHLFLATLGDELGSVMACSSGRTQADLILLHVAQTIRAGQRREIC